MSGAVLITGAAKRIGKFLAISLAEKGYDIAVHYNQSENEAVLLSGEIRKLGVKCDIFQADLSYPKKSSNLIANVFKKFPNLNVLINNASIFKACPLMDTSYDFLKQNFDINFFSPLLLSRYFAEICSNGRIINMLDTNIKKNKTNYFSYLLSKKTLADFTKLSAVELAPNIRVNGIAPGFILPAKNESEHLIKCLTEQLPLQKVTGIKDIIEGMTFLLDNNHITGQILYVDSGKHLC
ncbi:SDR family oxidoreductase [bacterium]|nr:SDR family oxidoreductase [bacterium]